MENGARLREQTQKGVRGAISHVGGTNCRDTTSVRRGPSLNILPDKSQTLILPSFARCLQLELSWSLAPGAAPRPAQGPAGVLPLPGAGRMLCLATGWLRAGRGWWPVLGYTSLRAELNGQARTRLFSDAVETKTSLICPLPERANGSGQPMACLAHALHRALDCVSKGKHDAK